MDPPVIYISSIAFTALSLWGDCIQQLVERLPFLLRRLLSSFFSEARSSWRPFIITSLNSGTTADDSNLIIDRVQLSQDSPRDQKSRPEACLPSFLQPNPGRLLTFVRSV